MALTGQRSRDLCFEDVFDVGEIQAIQDSFALATGMASLVTTVDGAPITRPSNFSRFCRDFVRASASGRANCIRSDAALGRYNADGPTVGRCLSAGLLDAGVSISVGGRHVANWLLGQVRTGDEDMGLIASQAEAFGADPVEYVRAFEEIPVLSEARFREVAQALFVIVNTISEKAYQQELLLREKRDREDMDALLLTLMNISRDGVVVIDQDHRVMTANRCFAEMLGYEHHEVIGLETWVYEARYSQDQIRESFRDMSTVNVVLETQHRRKDGTVFDVEVSIVGAALGGKSVVVAICRDITERLEAQRQLRRSEAHLRALFELSLDGFVLADPQCRILDANQAYCNMTGYTLEELRGLKDFYDITPRKWQEWQQREIWEKGVLATGSTDVYQKEYIHKDGHIFPVEIRDFAVYEDSGDIRHIWGIVRDITWRRQVEDWQRILLEMVEQSPVSIVLTDIEGCIEYVNPKFTEISGYGFSEVRGQNPRILNSGWKSAEEYAELWTTIGAGRQWRGVFHNKRKDGSLYWESALISPIRDSEGRIEHYVALKEDITQQRLAEEEIRKRDINFRQIVDILPQLVAYVDQDLCYRFVNAAYLQRFPDMELVGQPVSSVVGPEVLAAIRPHIEQALLGQSVHYTMDLPYPRGDSRYIDGHLIPDFDASGKARGYYAILNDLTHLRRVEESLRKAKEEAESANRLKSEFLANMSHEIRTPLNGIVGMLQVLRSADLTDEFQEFLDAALRSSERLTQLLNDILDIARIEADRLIIQDLPFVLADLDRGLQDLFFRQVREKNLDFSCVLDPGLPAMAVGDASRIMQVLFNLVGNSLKFTEQGRVEVMISSLPFLAGADLRVLIEVRDTGPGMSDTLVQDIFEPFVQQDGSYTRRHQGVGLGLSIVRKLILRMGGTLCVASAPGAGTAVFLSLPLGLPRDPQACMLRAEPAAALPMLRVLLVEDDPVNQLCGRSLLEKAGHTVEVAANGEEALELLSRSGVDLIFMDIQMPVMDGMQATRIIRQAEPFARFAHIPIIAVTAHAMAGDQEKFLAGGMDGYLSKPLDLGRVMAEMERVWHRRQAACGQ